jgi:hypothetical protein
MAETGPQHGRHMPAQPAEVTLGCPQPQPGMRPGGKPDELILPANVGRPLVKPTVAAPPATSPTPASANPLATSPGYPVPTIAIINQSTVLQTADVEAAVHAVQIQLNRDFAPAWGLTANLKMINSLAEVGQFDWLMGVLDDSDQAGALGYHTMADSGQPVGKIFARTDLQNDLSWTVTLSHEILEMVGDPYITASMFNQTSNTGGRLYAFEVADPCEADESGYNIDGILVSDFVYHAWFEAWRAAGSIKFDFTNTLNAPLAIGSDGYASVFPIPNKRGWLQVYANKIGKRLQLKLQMPAGSRTMRRVHGGVNKLEIANYEDHCIPVEQLDQETAS